MRHREQEKHCPDCGKVILFTSERCRKCNMRRLGAQRRARIRERRKYLEDQARQWDEKHGISQAA